MKRLKLRAAVQGNAKHHWRGKGESPEFVEIEQDDGGYYLFYLGGAGEFLSHTWHETLDAAKRQARLDLLMEDAEWAPVDR